jgi:hypothetical protein
VYAGDFDESTLPVNYITPGEVFGDLAILADGLRKATVVADIKSKEISLFGTDFSVFGKLEDIGGISLNTKLIFYRNMVHGIRWKLEVYKMEHADHPLVAKGRAVKMFIGTKGTKEELFSLNEQATSLSGVLTEWNIAFGTPKTTASAAESTFNSALAKDL